MEPMAESNPALLTVICTTYNHVSYIEHALESIIRQRTNFRFTVVVGDDASTDGTTDLVRQYAEKYPNLIQIFPRAHNLGMSGNALDLYQRVCSKYLAICEGDDYWTDEEKLQKQVDFLETHPDYAICFHPVALLNEPEGTVSGIFPDPKTRFNKLSLTLDDLLKHNFIQTNSVVFRWRFDTNDPELMTIISDQMQPGDYILHLMHAEIGKIGCLNEVMAVYRLHPGGAWAGAGIRDEWFLKWGVSILNFYTFVEKRFNYPQPRLFMLSTAVKLIMAALRAGLTTPIERLALAQPVWYEKAVTTLQISLPSEVGGKTKWRNSLKFALCWLTFLSKITWGKRKRHYLRKADEAHRQLEQLKNLVDDQ